MAKYLRIHTVVVAVFMGLFFVFSSVHAQSFDDFGGFGGWDYSDYGFDSFGSFGGGYEGAYDPCGFGGCGGEVSYDSYDYGSSYGSYSGCGFLCFGGFGGGYSYQPFTPFYGGGLYQTVSPSPVYAPSSIYAPTTIDDHSVVTTNVTTTASPAYTPSYSYPVYVPQPVYTVPPVYYPPPVYAPSPAYQQPIICSVQFTNFSPPGTAIPWQLYSYRVTAFSNIGGQMSYRLVSAPDGMGINSATGQITWTPGVNQTRSAAYQVTIAVYNGSCETAQSFYVTVRPQRIVIAPPPPVVVPSAPKPKLKPATVYGECVCPPAEKPVESILCPPTKITSDTGAGNDVVVSTSTVLANATSGFWGGIKALFASPFTLFLVIVILVILLVRAHRRMRGAQIVI